MMIISVYIVRFVILNIEYYFVYCYNLYNSKMIFSICYNYEYQLYFLKYFTIKSSLQITFYNCNRTFNLKSKVDI